MYNNDNLSSWLNVLRIQLGNNIPELLVSKNKQKNKWTDLQLAVISNKVFENNISVLLYKIFNVKSLICYNYMNFGTMSIQENFHSGY